MTLPVREPRTTSVSPELRAIRAMISSGAFPNVAFRKPPIPGPVWCAACSVASPISQASGTSASAASDEERDVADVGELVEGDRRAAPARAGRRGCGGPRRRHPILCHVLRAVLFDWGDTLFHFAYDEELLAAGWEAGLGTLERDGLPGPDEAAAVFRERYLPLLFVPGSVEEVEYPELIRELLGGFGVELADGELDTLPRRRARCLGARPAPRRPDARPPRLAPRARPHDRAGLERLRSRLAPAPGSRRHGARRAPGRGRLLVRGGEAQATPGRLRGDAGETRGRARAGALRRRPPLRGHARREGARNDDRPGLLVSGRRRRARASTRTSRPSPPWTSSTSSDG